MKNPYLYLIGQAWKYAGARRPFVILNYAIFGLANVAYLVRPLIIGNIINIVQKGGADILTDILPWLALIPGAHFLVWILHGPGRIMERQTAFFTAKNYTEAMFRKINELPFKWHKDHHTGETYDKIDKARTALFGFAQDTFLYLYTLSGLIIAMGIVVWFLPLYSPFIIVLGLVIAVIVRYFDGILIRQQKQINDMENHVASGLFDYISNISTVITLRLSKLAHAEVSQRIMKRASIFRKNTVVNEWKWFITDMIVVTGSALMLGLYIMGALRAEEGLLIGSVVAFYQYIERINQNYFDAVSQWEVLVERSTNVRSAESIIEAHETLAVKGEKKIQLGKWKSLEVRDLCFRYEDENHKGHHIKNFSLSLKKGTKMALVGESGSGKSTLMRLIRGMEEAESGMVLVDNKKEFPLASLKDITTLFPQDPEIFENSIEYNITAGVSHSAAEVEKAVDIAQFTSVLKRIPKGLASHIKEKGVNLSGGEKQRLALARGVFASKGSDIILMDEPTSSVDPANEMKIYKKLFALYEDKCMVSSLHRLHLLPLFDYVMVLEGGKVIQEGEVKKLLKVTGPLKIMWENYRQHMKTERK